MIKQITSGSDNWALAKSSNNKDLLLQVQKDGEQVRIVLPVGQKWNGMRTLIQTKLQPVAGQR